MGSSPEELAQLKRELEQERASDFDMFVAQSSGPRHVVELSQPFYMSQYEVTVAQFRQFVEETSYQPSAERAGNARFTWKSFVPETDPTKQPVCGVSWDDANAFCQWLTAKSSTDQSNLVYELPTEAQWEYACRAGSQSLWSSGDEAMALSEYAIVGQKGTPHPAVVGLRRANAFGLFDMHGNVDEWCLDWHNHDFYGRSALTDPVFNDSPKDAGSGRVARGGSWNADDWWSRSATRAYDFPTSPTFAKGFRVVGNLSP
jgi:formylglycine-generating enzyme required for sulfatase activity